MSKPASFVIAFAIITSFTGSALFAQQLPRVEDLSDISIPKTRPVYDRLDSSLDRLVQSGGDKRIAEQRGLRLVNEKVQIVAVIAGDSHLESVIAWLESEGAEHISSAGNLVQAFVDWTSLPGLMQLPGVSWVRKPYYVQRPPQPIGDPVENKILGVTSEGVAAMNANVWHAAGHSGDGISVAVIDVGFQGAPALVGSELPSSNVYFQSFGGTPVEGHPHGTACAEIVADIVPNMDRLYLYATSTAVDFSDAIAAAIANNVDVISLSMGWPYGPGDGTGYFANAVNSFHSSGGLFVSAAGNYARLHWQGPWRDANSNAWLDYYGQDEINSFVRSDGVSRYWVPAASDIDVTLMWNQWNRPSTDLNFCLYRLSDQDDPELVLCSEELQTGLYGQTPYERIEHTTDTAGYYGIAVWENGGSANGLSLEIFFTSHRPEYSVSEGSVTPPADTTTALSVAALDANTPFPIEYYSSRGPTNGSGGSLSGGRTKPDIAGYANVSTASYGPRAQGQYPFNGTSSAAPHVSGAAALVWSANPTWSNNQVRSYLESTAREMGPTGKDNAYGHGRLWLGNPPTSCSYSISPVSRSFSAAGSNGTVTVNTQSGCSWAAVENASWLSITSSSSGTGSGTISYNVAANSGAARSTSINIEGRIHTVSQSAGQSCSYSLSPGSRTHGASGGSATVTVSTQAGCTWNARSNNTGWLSITAGANGTGSGTVSYRVIANTSSSQRSGTLTIGGRTFTVTQSGAVSCTYSLAPLGRSHGASGGTATVSVTTSAGCSWNAASNNPGWLHVTSGSSGNGSVSVSYRVDANSSSNSRSGSMTIAGKTFNVTQNGSNGGGSRSYMVAGIAHAAASGNSTWRSSLTVMNQSGTTANLTLKYRFGSSPVTRTHSLPNNHIVEWEDVTHDLFQLFGNSSGSVEVVSNTPVIVTARTFNQTSNRTYGQFLPGAGSNSALTSAQIGLLPGIKKTGDFRCNVGFVNMGATTVSVRTTLYNQSGSKLGNSVTTNIGPGAWSQENDIFGKAGVSTCPIGFAKVEVLTAGGSVWSYASIVDNHSGDPTTIPMVVQ